jgi:hypothetical protein
MDTEYSGPLSAEGTAEFPTKGFWNVHGDFEVTMKYKNDVNVIVSGKFPNGLRFEGTEGWIFVSRGDTQVSASDPASAKVPAFEASSAAITNAVIKPNGIKLYDSPEQHRNWIECIQTKKPNISPVEVAHRSCSACLVAHAAMKLPRKLVFDPKKEKFENDAEANKLLSRPQRYPYGTSFIKA